MIHGICYSRSRIFSNNQSSSLRFHENIKLQGATVCKDKNIHSRSIMKLSNSIQKFVRPPYSSISSDSFNTSPSIVLPLRQRAFVRLRPTLSRDTGNNVIYLPPRDPRPAHRGEITATDTLSSSAASPAAFTHAYVSYLHLRVPSHSDPFLEMPPPAGGATNNVAFGSNFSNGR